MPLKLDGTYGVSGIVGTGSSAAIYGTDADSGIVFGTNETTITANGVGIATVNSGGINVAGVITATSFVGNISGVAATFTGNVSIAGTLTYEDVTNVDSVGLITARSGVIINSGGLQVTGVTTVAAGSTSAPTINPSGDSNTGIFFPAADTIAFSEGGAESGRFNSSGNLLIGTTSDTGTASQKLQVTGGTYVSGNIGVGVTNPSYKLDVSGLVRLGNSVAQGNPSTSDITTNAHTLLSGQGGNYLSIGQYTSGNNFAQWIQSTFIVPSTATYNIVLQPLGGNVGIATASPSERLHVVGNILASGNVTGYSDETLKNNVQTIPDALNKVSQLRGVEYDRNDIEGNPHQIGVIAQEVEKIIPEVVTTHEDGIKSVAYGNLVGLLIEAIKDLKDEVTELKARLEEV